MVVVVVVSLPGSGYVTLNGKPPRKGRRCLEAVARVTLGSSGQAAPLFTADPQLLHKVFRNRCSYTVGMEL